MGGPVKSHFISSKYRGMGGGEGRRKEGEGWLTLLR